MAKLDNMSFMVCCANGAGSSLMMKMTMMKMLTRLGIKPGKVHHCSVSEAKSSATQFDIVFCARNFVNNFKEAEKNGTTHVFGLRNIMSEKEMEQALRDGGMLD